MVVMPALLSNLGMLKGSQTQLEGRFLGKKDGASMRVDDLEFLNFAQPMHFDLTNGPYSKQLRKQINELNY